MFFSRRNEGVHNLIKGYDESSILGFVLARATIHTLIFQNAGIDDEHYGEKDKEKQCLKDVDTFTNLTPSIEELEKFNSRFDNQRNQH